MLNITLSKKQQELLKDIVSQNKYEIYVLGSTQSGKTFDICLACILYAQALHQYDPNELYFGSITAWTLETLKGNILEPLKQFLTKLGLKPTTKKSIGDYELRWQSEDKYIQLWNIRFYFTGFNNVLAFNKILGKPLIFEWIDEAARIYTQKQLQEPFNEFPGRQVSYANHPYRKTIHSFNVEGGENHDYKLDYIDKKPKAIHYTFFPFDNPKINTKEAMEEVINIFPKGSLREQKIYNKWITSTGRVFPEINVINDLKGYSFREIGIGIDYGSQNATTFVPIALAYNNIERRWVLIRLQIYYHNSRELNDTPTTEYFSNQLRMFLVYLKNQFPQVPIKDIVIDSEASHFHNRLLVDNIPHTTSKKGPGSVNEGVQHLQSLIYKKYFYVLKMDSIREILPNGQNVYCGKDEGIVEFESYQYDTIRSQRDGVDCFKKEFDHQVDSIRYLLALWQELNKCPVV